MKKGLSIVLAASVIVALAAGLVGYAPAQAEDAQWTASYWNNTTLKGKAVVTRQEDAISYNWGTASPIPRKVKKDGFSIRWKRTVNFAEGPYVFTACADDGVRVWIGFGFVEMPNKDEAIKAIESLNCKDLKGRNLKVN